MSHGPLAPAFADNGDLFAVLARPGEGGVNWDASFAALKEAKYNGWLMIEAFGLALPDLAAATKIWRKMFPSEEHLATKGLAFMKKRWGA